MPVSFWALDSWGSSILGPFYSAATGKVDPWTKSILAQNQAEDIVKAQGGDPSDTSSSAYQDALAQAQTDVEHVSSTTPAATADCSNPSDFLTGLNCSLKKFETAIIVILIIGIVLYLAGKHLSSPRLLVRGRT